MNALTERLAKAAQIAQAHADCVAAKALILDASVWGAIPRSAFEAARKVARLSNFATRVKIRAYKNGSRTTVTPFAGVKAARQVAAAEQARRTDADNSRYRHPVSL